MPTEYRAMQQTRGVTADWEVSSRILLDGELGFEKSTPVWRFKIGDGVTAWADLPYMGETDTVARDAVTALTTTVGSIDTRVTDLEDASSDVTQLQQDVDALEAQVGGLQPSLGTNATLGDVVFYDGTQWTGVTVTVGQGVVLYWDATAEEYRATNAPTERQHLVLNSSGVPTWTSDYRVPDGTEALPGMAFFDDPDTGLHRPAANEVAAVGGGVVRAQFGARATFHVVGDNANGTTTARFDKNEASEVILQAFNPANPTQYHTLNLNKAGGDVLINDAAVASSAALKRDIADIRMGVDTLQQLRVVSFRRRDRNTRRTELGFVAEEVAKVAPEAVSRHEDGTPSGVYLADMLALVTKAAQDMAARLTDIEDRLRRLENPRY